MRGITYITSSSHHIIVIFENKINFQNDIQKAKTTLTFYFAISIIVVLNILIVLRKQQ